MKNKLVTADVLLAVTFFMPSLLFGMENKSISSKSFYDNDNTVLKVYDKRSLERTIQINVSLIEKLPFDMAYEHSKKIGQHCKDFFETTETHQIMAKLLSDMNGKNYWKKRPEALILTCAGAYNIYTGVYPNNFHSLLTQASLAGDGAMLKVLFDNGEDPNRQEGIIGWKNDGKKICNQVADWFWSKDIGTVKTFTDHKVDLNTGGIDDYPNVLWFALQHCSPELVFFYLENNVDTKGIDGRTQDCIWHHLIRCRQKFPYNVCWRIGTFLIKSALDMINIKNKDGHTPLGLVYIIREALQQSQILLFDEEWNNLDLIITLLENNGANK